MTPRVHGNGFIQLQITERTRIHIWPYEDDRLKVQQTNTGVHSHRFTFHSMILRGSLLHTKYAFVVGGKGQHRLWVPDKDEGLVPTEIYGDLRRQGHKCFNSGESYCMEAGDIHETRPYGRSAVTVMTKLSILPYPPVVVIPVGQEPDNNFDRDKSNDPRVLWEIIKELI